MKDQWIYGVGIGILLGCSLLFLRPTETRGMETAGRAAVELPPPLAALTFDDGPRRDTTGPLLEGLALREIPATFFLVGERIPGNEELLKRMKAEGHQLGVHTYSHVKLTELNRAEYEEQIGKTRALLERTLGPGDYWLRPPYGSVNDQVKNWADGPLVLWSVDPEDWKNRDARHVTEHVLNSVRDGDIILLHDLYPSSVEAALEIADGLLDRGFCFVTVEQLLQVRGGVPAPGQVLTRLPPSAH